MYLLIVTYSCVRYPRMGLNTTFVGIPYNTFPNIFSLETLWTHVEMHANIQPQIQYLLQHIAFNH